VGTDLRALAGGQDASILGPEHASAIEQHFDYNLVGKSHDGGWPRLTVELCPRCGARYLVYAGVKEPANGFYIITVQGIVELRPETPSV